MLGYFQCDITVKQIDWIEMKEKPSVQLETSSVLAVVFLAHVQDLSHTGAHRSKYGHDYHGSFTRCNT